MGGPVGSGKQHGHAMPSTLGMVPWLSRHSPDIIDQQHGPVGHDGQVTGIEVGQDLHVPQRDLLLGPAIEHWRMGTLGDSAGNAVVAPTIPCHILPSATSSALSQLPHRCHPFSSHLGTPVPLTFEHSEVLPGHGELAASHHRRGQHCQQGAHYGDTGGQGTRGMGIRGERGDAGTLLPCALKAPCSWRKTCAGARVCSRLRYPPPSCSSGGSVSLFHTVTTICGQWGHRSQLAQVQPRAPPLSLQLLSPTPTPSSFHSPRGGGGGKQGWILLPIPCHYAVPKVPRV